MKIQNITILVISLLIISCKSNRYDILHENLKECVNKSINENIGLENGTNYLDFYNTMTKVEELLINEELIVNHYKSEYYKLLLKDDVIQKKEKAYTKIVKLCDDLGFNYNSFEIINNVFSRCPNKILKDVENMDYNQFKTLNKLIANGYDNKKIITELFDLYEKQDLDKIVYRAPIILLAIINFDRKFNPLNKRLKEKIKGKKFLGNNN